MFEVPFFLIVKFSDFKMKVQVTISRGNWRFCSDFSKLLYLLQLAVGFL